LKVLEYENFYYFCLNFFLSFQSAEILPDFAENSRSEVKIGLADWFEKFVKIWRDSGKGG